MILTIELVPSSCWFSNVREAVSNSQWETIKKATSLKANHRCEICNGVGPKWPVECHEIWHYDDSNHIQSLTGTIALCPDCHMVKHFGLARVKGNERKATAHLREVSGLSSEEADSMIEKAFAVYRERSNHKWILNLEHLETAFGIKDYLKKESSS